MEFGNPFECLLCLTIYNEDIVPTTLPCGHSCCLTHVRDLNECIYCREVIPRGFQAKPSYNLRDAAIVYLKMLKERQILCRPPIEEAFSESWIEVNSNDDSLPDCSTDSENLSVTAELRRKVTKIIHEIEEQQRFTSDDNQKREREQQEMDRLLQEQLEESRRMAAALREEAARIARRNTRRSAQNTIQSTSQEQPSRVRPRDGVEVKSCGHQCTVSSLQRCCACLDIRPVRMEGTYPTYVDGRGWANLAFRDAGYCPECNKCKHM